MSIERQFIKLTATLTKIIYESRIYSDINWKYYVDYYNFGKNAPYDRFWRSMQWADSDIPVHLSLFLNESFKDNKVEAIAMIIEIVEETSNHLKDSSYFDRLKAEYDIFQDLIKSDPPIEYEYDIAISFAGENRNIAHEIALSLKTNGVKVFYDKFETVHLWGKDLSTHFQDIYGKNSKFVLILVSEYYPIKDWTNFEFSIAKRSLQKGRIDFILPLRIDDTPLVGLKDTTAYISYDNNPEEIASYIIQKLTEE